MRKRKRFTYLVVIDRDEVPGWNHQPEDFEGYLKRHLNEAIGHYNPTVTIVPTPHLPHNQED